MFGGILLGEGAYNSYQQKTNEKVSIEDPGNQPTENVPTIQLTQTENNQIIIHIESTIAISHLIYSWNNQGAQTIDETGKTVIEETIDIPRGENVLNLSVIDSNGIETKKTETYILEISKPTIELFVVGDDIKMRKTSKLEFETKLNLDNIISLIPEEILNYKAITKDIKEYIQKISFIYNFDEDRMSEIIRNSINMKKNIDKSLLRENARRYYQFENSGRLPSLIYRSQPEYLRKPTGDSSKKAKIIYQFETTSPYDFLCSKYNGIKPSKGEINLLEYLLFDMDLKPGVVNVLIDYVLKINNNKLTKKFIETIAAQWAKSKVETVEAAMKLAEKEYKSRNIYINKNKSRNIETVPTWFNKKISENKASQSEIDEMNKMLSEFK